MSNPFPSLKARAMQRILERLGYKEVRCKGSHRQFGAEGRRNVTLAFHTGASLAPGEVRDILVKQVGLTLEEALKVVRDG